MKKQFKTDISTYSVLFFFYIVVFGAVISLASSLFNNELVGIISGLALMLGAIPLYFVSARRRGASAGVIILNCIGTALAASAYFSAMGIVVKLTHSISIALALGLVFLVMGLIIKWQRNNAAIFILIFILLTLALLVYLGIMWATKLTAIYSILFFFFFILLINLVVLSFSFGDKGRSGARDFALGSFGVISLVGVAAVVAIAIFADGDCDCGDADCLSDCFCDLDCFDRKRKRAK